MSASMLAPDEALEKDKERRPDMIPFLLLPLLPSLSAELLLLLLERLKLIRMVFRQRALRVGVRRGRVHAVPFSTRKVGYR
jgi:hypothetical protein